MKTRNIIIRLDSVNEELTEEDVMEFVWNAVTSWGGQFRLEDPLFDSLDVKEIQMGKLVMERKFKGMKNGA